MLLSLAGRFVDAPGLVIHFSDELVLLIVHKLANLVVIL
jgi:hypothetical protein